MAIHRYTNEEREFLKEYVPGHSYEEIRSAFTEKFGWQIATNQVKGYIGNNKLSTGRTGRFEKGITAHNKGKKMSPEVYEKAKKTMFRKGNIPKNYRPVGSERIDTKNGYVLIKVKDPNVWRLKHRVIWENAHGKIPKGCAILFRDGNKQNITLDNLLMVKKGVNAALNNSGLVKYTGELKETAVRLAELKLETRRVKKGKTIENPQIDEEKMR